MTKHGGPDARQRMAAAALELFDKRGYDAVSAAEIAARAGVTERTFFRHFSSKREVLFDGEAVLRDALLEAIADVPAATAPLDTLLRCIRSVVPLLEANRPFAEPRQKLVDRTPALAERELAKLAALTTAMADMLKIRGIGEPSATMAARAAMSVFAQATLAWFADPEGGLDARIAAASAALKGLVTDGAG